MGRGRIFVVGKAVAEPELAETSGPCQWVEHAEGLTARDKHGLGGLLQHLSLFLEVEGRKSFGGEVDVNGCSLTHLPLCCPRGDTPHVGVI